MGDDMRAKEYFLKVSRRLRFVEPVRQLRFSRHPHPDASALYIPNAARPEHKDRRENWCVLHRRRARHNTQYGWGDFETDSPRFRCLFPAISQAPSPVSHPSSAHRSRANNGQNPSDSQCVHSRERTLDAVSQTETYPVYHADKYYIYW